MTPNELIMLQHLPLDIKIAKTKLRIQEWYERYGGNVYISFSGGKDSTVLLHIVREMYPDIPAVYLDTGLEYPEIRDFVKTFDNVIWLKPEMSFLQVIKKWGYPVISKEQAQYIYDVRNTKSEKQRNTRLNGNKWGLGKVSEKWKFLIDTDIKISDKCCNELKKKPVKKYEKESGRKAFIGVMANESEHRKKEYLRTGCNSFDSKRPISRPLGFWRECDIWDYINTYKIPYSKLYDMGYERSGCAFCMFGCHLEKEPTRFQRMKQTHPQLWNYCIYKLGLGKILDLIKVKYE